MIAMKQTHTLKQLIALIMTVILLFLILTTTALFTASRKILDSHIQAVGGASLDYYRSQLDSTLERINVFCQSSVFTGLNVMDRSDDLMEQYLEKTALSGTLSSLLSLSPELYFTMAAPNGSGDAIVRSRCSSMTHSDAIRDFLLDRTGDPSLYGQWQWLEIDGAWYLTRFYSLGGGFCAVCVDSSILAMASEDEKGLYLFCRQNGSGIACNEAVRQSLSAEPSPGVSMEIDGQSYALLSTSSIQGPFSIHCLAASATTELQRYVMQQIAVLILFCLSAVACFMVVLKYTTGAFTTLNHACGRVSQGDLSTEITKEPRFAEEGQIYAAFNDMIGQIQDLRIDLYEQALYAQHSKLEFLRIQIKSHFFVNCLTVIHTLAMAGNTALIEEFALCLADYFRYLGTGFSDTVSFGSELEHLNNFVKLHQIRYPGHITYRYVADPALEDFRVLPMVPQTFVENVFKHAMGVTEDIELTIRAEAAEGGMWLEIRDNGPGFTQKQLTILNDPGSLRRPDKQLGTGIANTRERLQLFYRDRSQVRFENDNGAVVRVFFPAVKEKGVS